MVSPGKVRTRVKICGITRPEDGAAAAELGADAIGLVFYPPSPRAVGVERAAEIVQALPPFVTAVALFVNAPAQDIRDVLARVPVGLLQFHGDESPEDCAGFGRPYIKAVPMRDGVDVRRFAREYASAQALLLDTYREGVPGGTGAHFEWSRVPADVYKPVILAGGLNPDNVVAAIHQVHPYAVDVSGGVEAGKGIKDARRIGAFMREVSSVGAS